jgi:GR25 family glycosyltransferase involved in LPS biosynthesis
MVNRIYLLSHPDFKDRREVITNRLKEENLDFYLVENYSPSEIDHEGLTKNWFEYHQIIIEQVGRYSYRNVPMKISPSSLSLVLKHTHCWSEQVTDKLNYVLILEDDCEIPYGFGNLISDVLEECIEGDYDLVMIGAFSDFISPNIKEGRNIHFDYKQKTRCTHAYIINESFSKIMLDGFGNINNPIDIKMNEVIQINKAKVAWLEPGLKQIQTSLSK